MLRGRLSDTGGPSGPSPPTMVTLDISDELHARLESHCEDDESIEEFLTELLAVYETEGAFLQEGYSE